MFPSTLYACCFVFFFFSFFAFLYKLTINANTAAAAFDLNMVLQPINYLVVLGHMYCSTVYAKVFLFAKPNLYYIEPCI